jgi:sodium--glutamate symport carrier gltS
MGGAALQSIAAPVMAGANATADLPLLPGMATLGLLFGGVIGGPLYAMLTGHTRSKPAQPPQPSPLNPPALLQHLFAYFLVITIGLALGPHFSPYLPAFAAALVAASLWRMANDAWQLSRLDMHYINTLGNVSLSLCLALAFMNMDLGKLGALPAGAFVLALMQVALVLAVAVLAVYRPLGANQLAAMIAAGLPGFSLGLPPDTMATLQNIQEQNSPQPMVTFVVPVVGAWLITFINPWIFN